MPYASKSKQPWKCSAEFSNRNRGIISLDDNLHISCRQSKETLEQAAQRSGEVTIPGGILKTWDHSLVVYLAVLG